ncbi:hypothetical protein MXAN_4238 [Myxococcus xanthus DK 1622]|uniref:Uncharacterized protein n=1 Tax=Myxococcus xanthus (strain DK1622) TaxID=246197 RepID=Q1D4L0_MYXXD|nr:hypothetical protein MXAN_4238 [Myxococcus xanthus DK 1622]
MGCHEFLSQLARHHGTNAASRKKQSRGMRVEGALPAQASAEVSP